MTMQEKTRSTIEIGAVFAAFLFLITLAFNAGIQYGEIGTLQVNQDANTRDIRTMQKDSAAQTAQNAQTLEHIETLVEDMRAEQELKRTGAMH